MARIIAIPEALDEMASQRLICQIRDHVARGSDALVVDLRQLDRLDFRMLSLLITLLRTVRETGGSLGLIVDQPDVMNILSVTALDRVFRVYGNECDAVAASCHADVSPAENEVT